MNKIDAICEHIESEYKKYNILHIRKHTRENI